MNNSTPNNIYCINMVKWILVEVLLDNINKFVMVLPLHLQDEGMKKIWHKMSLNKWEHIVRLKNVVESDSCTSVDRNNLHAEVIKMASTMMKSHSLLQYVGSQLFSIRHIRS